MTTSRPTTYAPEYLKRQQISRQHELEKSWCRMCARGLSLNPDYQPCWDCENSRKPAEPAAPLTGRQRRQERREAYARRKAEHHDPYNT
jgi:hypothetical protein